MNHRLAEFFRFANVSLFATVVDYGIGYLLTQPGLTSLVVATGVGHISGMIVGFVLNKFWVFRDKSTTETTSQLIRYVVVSLGNGLLNTLGVWGLNHLGVDNYWVVRILVGSTVFVFYSYVFTRLFVFMRKSRPVV
ncbi:GtrA family protein [Fibrisoma montanum]|uniref:GtrA family protein n=1 Tax=Fibrisoma montanum TaxID=2305895 RepID=A0A418MBU9_9BACT|nr:GtrA family protein [Fibrisoma montanum]RIV23820.1 GtrA family protein [Fibrisoma montanum]